MLHPIAATLLAGLLRGFDATARPQHKLVNLIKTIFTLALLDLITSPIKALNNIQTLAPSASQRRARG
jgi:hypothetical protein